VSGRKRRRKISVQPQSHYNSDINITPMVDVVLVLLIIFMVVTPLLEKDIDVKVPDTEQANEPEEVSPDQLVVTVSATGDVKINQELMSSNEAYIARLSQALSGKKKSDRVVFFTADNQANYAKLVTAIDGARQAGAETLGIATENPSEP
jgi:biopolymer transport protein ExbD/biopolymer transport protein TolR